VIVMTRFTFTTRPAHTVRPLLVPASLVALAIVPVVAGAVRLAGLTTGQPSAGDARFFAAPLPVTLHILSVIPYALLGALEFVPALRRRTWHRAAGVALVPLGLLAALTGIWMAHFYPWPAGDGEVLYAMRLIVGTGMTLSIVRGTVCLVRHDYVAHGAWMRRGYALGMGAGTQVFTHLPWFIFVGGAPSEGSRAVMMGLGWIVNAAVAEYVIRTRLATRGRATSSQAHAALLSTT
jgi:hypothetical protein